METWRVFGLGLSRTGTTSLHAAAVILGFPAVHHPLGLATRWMSGDFSRGTMGPFSVYTDLPVPVYFREFDSACPNSRFILTVRDPAAWIDSVERYFTSSPPSSEQTLQRDVIRLLCYGVSKFHRQRFLDVYLRHIDQVTDHFRNRPGDLLVFDLAKESDPWLALARFLERPAPRVRYPHLLSPAIGDLQRVTSDQLPDKRRRMFALVYGQGETPGTA